MDKRKEVAVIIKPKAEQSIVAISIFIGSRGYPETALKFKDTLYEFAYSLSILPDKYPICKYAALAKRNFHCAVFHKNFIFIYKIVAKKVVIYNVIHTHTNPAFHNA
jgi:hypothetical protein